MTIFGVPYEVRDLEMRVGLTPAGVLTLTESGHAVHVERNAGRGAGFSDSSYEAAGAKIVYSAAEVYGRADIVAKIARPTAQEHRFFRPGQTILSFLHLSVASPDLLQALEEREITAFAYELIEEEDGHRPVMVPPSEVAGRMAPLVAGAMLRSDLVLPGHNGLGILPSGIPGVPPAVVVILGGGVLGSNAARAFVGLGAEVTVLDSDTRVLQRLDEQFDSRVTTMFANGYNLKRAVRFADVLIGAVAIPGQRAPVLVTRDMVREMRPGSVIIDFAIDAGGCIATSRPTTLQSPAYVSEGVVHYCVPNMPAAYARTTSYAITNAALPYLLAIGAGDVRQAIREEVALLRGLTLYKGRLVHPGVAAALGREPYLGWTNEAAQ